ncbi:MAG: polyprenyl synthetase family protein [Haliscomenobacter sp.]|nr:polyprenyl synthetase family protein [Haliscomenobacter sp.]
MKISIDSIKNPIDAELEQFEAHFREAMRSPVPLLDKITYYIVRRKGKQMRPMFVFLCAKISGGVSESTFSAASLVELLHTATLVHDDVVDDSFERRGFFSINALWKNKIAVLVGDYLFSQGMLLALKNKEYRLLEIVSDAVKAMSEGELLQIEKARRLDIQEDVYFEIIRQKTASLIASACSAGAASATKDEAVIEKVRLFGEKIGSRFRSGMTCSTWATTMGKPLGIDIKEKKLTLPVIYALRHASRSDRNRMINNIRRRHDNPENVKEVIQFVRSSGGIEYAQEKMLAYRKEALDLLYTFPDSPSRQSLEDLIYFATERKK